MDREEKYVFKLAGRTADPHVHRVPSDTRDSVRTVTTYNMRVLRLIAHDPMMSIDLICGSVC